MKYYFYILLPLTLHAEPWRESSAISIPAGQTLRIPPWQYEFKGHGAHSDESGSWLKYLAALGAFQSIPSYAFSLHMRATTRLLVSGRPADPSVQTHAATDVLPSRTSPSRVHLPSSSRANSASSRTAGEPMLSAGNVNVRARSCREYR